jgi:transcriptional regulator with XRE-family HTH domain
MILEVGIGKGQRGLTEDMATRLREFMAARIAEEGLNQSRLAEKIGCKPSTISRFLNGDRGSWQLAEDTAKAFRVDVYEMVRGELPHAAASKATPLGTPNYRAACEQAGDLVSPLARRRVLRTERVGDFDPPVGWWAQRLAAEETIVRLERDLDRLRGSGGGSG